jgi:hypothetical protein
MDGGKAGRGGGIATTEAQLSRRGKNTLDFILRGGGGCFSLDWRDREGLVAVQDGIHLRVLVQHHLAPSGPGRGQYGYSRVEYSTVPERDDVLLLLAPNIGLVGGSSRQPERTVQ